MKTSVVFTCVLAGLAIDVIAYRININANKKLDNSQQWLRSNQEQLFRDGPLNDESILMGKVLVDRFDDQFNKYLNGDNTQFSPVGHDVQYDEFEYGSAGVKGENYQMQLKGQNQDNFDDLQTTTTSLAMKMVQKIAALQKIAVDNYNVYNGALHADYLNGALNINKNVVKMPKQQFVNFYNMTMKNLNNGVLEYLYVNPDKDIIYVQYKFVRVETKGSFKSDVENAKRGYFTVVLNKVHSNVTTGFKDHQHAAVIRPAHFEYADVDFKTEDGAETRAFDDVLEHKFLRVLTDAVTGEVSRYTNDKGMVVQIKDEIRKPMVVASRSAANSGGKLFDLKWKQNNVAMEMFNVGYRNLERAAEKSLFTAMSIENQSENSYTTRYNFTLKDLEWTSALNVVSVGNRMTARNVHCEVENIKIQVTINKSLDRPQSCGKFNTNVQVTGLQYNLDHNSQSELVFAVENQFQRFIEKSSEFYFQDNLRQQICYGRNY